MKNINFFYVLFIVFITLHNADINAANLSPSEEESEFSFSTKAGQLIHMTKPEEKPEVILIEDAHANPSAQENISLILQEIVDAYGYIPSIGIEGSSRRIDYSPILNFPYQESIRTAAHHSIKKGKLFAEEHFILLSPIPSNLVGLEEENIYKENRSAFLTVKENQKNLNQIIDPLENTSWKKAESHFNPELLDVYRLERNLEKGEISYHEFLKICVKKLKDLEIPLDHYPNLLLLIEYQENEKKLDFDLIQHEHKQFINLLKTSLNQTQFQNILKNILNYRLGRISAVNYYQILIDQPPNIPLKEYTVLLNYFEYLKIMERIDWNQIIEEQKLLLEKLKDVLIQNKKEELLGRFITEIYFLRRYFALEINSDEYQQSKSELFQTANDIEPLISGIRVSLDKLQEYSPSVITFYQGALKRDTIIAQNALLLKATTSKPICIIVGGFHTEGIKRFLERNNINIAIIRPKITSFPQNSIYLDLLEGNSSPLSRLLTTSFAAIRPRPMPERVGDFLEFQLEVLEHALSTVNSIDGARQVYERSFIEARERRTEAAELLDDLSFLDFRDLGFESFALLGPNHLTITARTEVIDKVLNQIPAQLNIKIPDQELVQRRPLNGWTSLTIALNSIEAENLRNLGSLHSPKLNIATVWTAMERYSNVHRGTGQHAQVSTYLYERSRELIGKHLGLDPDTEFLVQATNSELATQALSYNLNLEDQALVLTDQPKPWDKFSQYFIPITNNDTIDMDELERLMRLGKINLLAIHHPHHWKISPEQARSIADLAHAHNVIFFIDASIWHPSEVDFSTLGADILIFSGESWIPMTPTYIRVAQNLLKTDVDEAPYDKGGDTKLINTQRFVVWARGSIKFEVGTPNIAGPVFLARYLENPENDPIPEIELDVANPVYPLEHQIVIDTTLYTDLPKYIHQEWNKFIQQHGFSPKDETMQDVAYYITELAKNVLFHGGRIGSISISFSQDNISIMIEDDGPGFWNPLVQIQESTGGGHGLWQTMTYSDTFTIETQGDQYSKDAASGTLVESGSSSVTSGSRIHFSKAFPVEARQKLNRLRKELIGHEITVPTSNGETRYTNFDNGASTPTFRPVLEAIHRFISASKSVQRTLIEAAEKNIHIFFGAPIEEYELIGTRSTSEAINLFSHHFPMSENDMVVNSLLEHNSNELPWRSKNQLRLPVDKNGFIDLRHLEDLLRAYNEEHQSGDKRIKLLTISGASNVLGTTNDLDALATLAHRYGAKILIDAAQLAAHRKIDMTESDIDYIAISAHKIYAPFGYGALLVRKDALEPESLTAMKDNAGSANNTGMIGLSKSLDLLNDIGMQEIAKHEEELLRYALSKIKDLQRHFPSAKIDVYGIADPDSDLLSKKTGVIPFNMNVDESLVPENLKGQDYLPHALIAAILAEVGGIGVRSGCFCADLLMGDLLGISLDEEDRLKENLLSGTRAEIPGAVRLSFGIYNTLEELDIVFSVFEKILNGSIPLEQYQQDIVHGEYFTPEHLVRMDAFFQEIERSVFGSAPPGSTLPWKILSGHFSTLPAQERSSPLTSSAEQRRMFDQAA